MSPDQVNFPRPVMFLSHFFFLICFFLSFFPFFYFLFSIISFFFNSEFWLLGKLRIDPWAQLLNRGDLCPIWTDYSAWKHNTWVTRRPHVYDQNPEPAQSRSRGRCFLENSKQFVRALRWWPFCTGHITPYRRFGFHHVHGSTSWFDCWGMKVMKESKKSMLQFL